MDRYRDIETDRQAGQGRNGESNIRRHRNTKMQQVKEGQTQAMRQRDMESWKDTIQNNVSKGSEKMCCFICCPVFTGRIHP